MAETATVGELLVRIRADITELERGLNAGQRSVAAFSQRAAPGIRTIENSFRALAFQAAGIPGPIGRITHALLTMSAGGTVTLGVIAGIGLIALAWRKLTSDAREAAEAQRDALRAAIETPMFQAMEKLRLAEKALADAEAKRRGVTGVAAFTPFGGQRFMEATKEINEARRAVEYWQEEVVRLDDAFQALVQRIEGAKLPERLRIAGLNAPGLVPEIVQIGRPSIAGVPLAQLNRVLPNQQQVAAGIAALNERFSNEVRKRYENFQQIGQTIGWALADGINAVLGGQNFFKSFFRTLIGIGIQVGSAFVGGQITKALGGGISLNLAGMPAAANPVAAARDAQWQAFLKDSLLVANSGGFRG